MAAWTGQCIPMGAAGGGEGEPEMKLLRSMAFGLMAVGLALGATGMGHAQGSGQRTGGMSGGGMSSGGMSTGGMSTGQSQTGMSQTGQVPASQQSPTSQTTTGLTSLPGAEDTPSSIRTEQDMEKLRNGERQKRLVSDTEKLVALVNELKIDMDKTNKDMLSLDVIRKADEIEKLAHSVKEKMKGQ
jgi:hypothetical protein